MTCASSVVVNVSGRTRVSVSVPITPDEDSSYAVLGKVTDGGCQVTDACIRVQAP